MRIGIDFDNTIVCYDTLFYHLALEHGCHPDRISANKRSIRDYYRSIDQEDIWTGMQGIAYGPRILEAIPFPGILNFMIDAHAAGHQLFIVSHKTKNPFRGEPHDLHQAALSWLTHHQVLTQIIPREQIFFELTKAEKIARIATLKCECFIDDLPEILSDAAFPTSVSKVLFDPAGEHSAPLTGILLRHWDQANSIFQEQC